MKLFNDKGSVLVVLIIAMTLIAILGAAFVSMISSKQQGFTLLINGHRANMLARAGIEWAIRSAADQYGINGARPINPNDPNEGSFTVSYNESNNILTVEGNYQGVKATTQLSNFSRYVKKGDVTFPLSIASFKSIESVAGKSIAVEPTGVVRLGLNTQNTFGAVWYGGNNMVGNCLNGLCDFSNGLRAYFIFQYGSKSKGDGFTFSIINGANNTMTSIGGDSKMGELMAYGGDSRLYDADNYIQSFVDRSGHGLRPPKFAVEFDIYKNTDCPSNCCNSGRCDPSNQHMAYVFWGDDIRVGCKDDYTRWMGSFIFPANSVVYGKTGSTTYLYRSLANVTTKATEPIWLTDKGSITLESGVQWQECSWRASTIYHQNDVVAPKSANGYFFRKSNPGNHQTSDKEPVWAQCINAGTQCTDGEVKWENAAFYGSPAISVNYVTNSRTYDDNKHYDGTGTDSGDNSGVGPTNSLSSGSYYSDPANPATWLADTANSNTVNSTYAYRMEIIRNKSAGSYRIKSWIVACDPIWTPSTNYTIDDQTRPTHNNGYYYAATSNGKSGPTEPIWLTDQPTIDGTITWMPIEIPPVWTASTAYAAGKLVMPTVNKGYYYYVRIAGTSGSTEPIWSSSESVLDGSIIWEPLVMPICSKYTNTAFGDVQTDYSGTPVLDRTILLDTTYNNAFDKFLFGWTTASGGATQKVDVWKFRLSFKP